MSIRTSENTERAKLALSMFIFGTIGVFRRGIDLPSSFIALSRAAIGTIFLLAVILIKKDRISWSAVRKNLLLLCRRLTVFQLPRTDKYYKLRFPRTSR